MASPQFVGYPPAMTFRPGLFLCGATVLGAALLSCQSQDGPSRDQDGSGGTTANKGGTETSLGGAIWAGGTSTGGSPSMGGIGGSGGDSPIDSHPAIVCAEAADVETFSPCVVDAVCTRMAECCALYDDFTDTANCQSRATEILEGSFFDPDPALVTFDPENGRKCIEYILMTPCSLATEFSYAYCDRAFVGSTPAGQPCTTAAECERPEETWVSCYSETGDGPSVCVQEEPRPGLGDYCEFLGECRDDEGVFCHEGLQECVPQGSLGDPCTGREHCLDPLFCWEGECAPERIEGQTCIGPYDCDGAFVCEGFEDAPDGFGTCVPPGAKGMECESESECRGGECVDLVCTSPITETCAGFPFSE